MTMLRLLPLLALAAAGPAFATGGFTCAADADPDVRLSIVTGMAPGMVIAQARLQQGGLLRGTVDEGPDALRIVQAWVDEEALKLDLADRDHMAYVAKLRAARGGDGRITGTLALGGRRLPVTCTSEH